MKQDFLSNLGLIKMLPPPLRGKGAVIPFPTVTRKGFLSPFHCQGEEVKFKYLFLHPIPQMMLFPKSF